jgi:hypothetical protein
VTAAVLDRPISFSGPDPAGHGATLEDLLNAALHRARTDGSTECPVCHGSMTSTRAGARGAAPVAECGDCGSRLT